MPTEVGPPESPPPPSIPRSATSTTCTSPAPAAAASTRARRLASPSAPARVRSSRSLRVVSVRSHSTPSTTTPSRDDQVKLDRESSSKSENSTRAGMLAVWTRSCGLPSRSVGTQEWTASASVWKSVTGPPGTLRTRTSSWRSRASLRVSSRTRERSVPSCSRRSRTAPRSGGAPSSSVPLRVMRMSVPLPVVLVPGSPRPVVAGPRPRWVDGSGGGSGAADPRGLS